MMLQEWKCFVLMPFAEEFDDVYLLLRDVPSAVESHKLNIFRADDIAEPGRITDQILQAIKDCDFVIADVTRSNPNVMFELGYSRALGKPTIIITQDIAQSPFDIKEMRQIVYDRARLVGDLRPQVTSAVKATLSHLVQTASEKIAYSDAGEDLVQKMQDEIKQQVSHLQNETISAAEAFDRLLSIELEIELANELHDSTRLRELAMDAKKIIDGVNLSEENPAIMSRLAGQIGDTAVEFHNVSLYQEAEDLFNRALKMDDKHAGVHIQYALFYALHKRDFAKAEEFLKRAESLGGDVSRIEAARIRINVLRAHTEGIVDTSLLQELKTRYENQPNEFENVAAYLLALQRIGQWDEIIRVGEQIIERDNDPSTERGYAAFRSYADVIALSNDRKHEQIAMRLYESILTSRPKDGEVMSNYAVLLMKGSGDEQVRALSLLVDAYNLMPEEPKVRRGLSNLLGRIFGLRQIAAKVMRGLELSPDELNTIRQLIDEKRS